MTPEDQAAFEAAWEAYKHTSARYSSFHHGFEAALAHRDAQIESLQDALDETNAECIRIHKVNQQMLKALKVLVENGGIGPEQMFHDARDAITAAEAMKGVQHATD